MREAREAGQLSDPKPAGRPPLKFPPEIAGPLIRRYLMDQRREGQPVTIGHVLEHLAGLQEPVVVFRECLRLTMLRCGLHFGRPKKPS